MRGKAYVQPVIVGHDGITPAHAGKRSDKTLEDFRGWDHPRPCGEKVGVRVKVLFGKGSPPPMRGKVVLPYGHGKVSGITPALAGKSLSLRCASSRRRDHPRPCGEKRAIRHIPAAGAGSPPPMRGKVSQLPTAAQTSRITPAHAGKRESFRVKAVRADHPRPCGEKPTILQP